MNRLEAKEKKKERPKVKEEESELTIEVVIPPAKERRLETYDRELPDVEWDLEGKTIKAKKIEVPLLIPYFHVAERITEKMNKKGIYLEIGSSAINTVGIPQFNFREKSDVAIKPCKKDLIMPKTRMYEIISHLLDNIPEREFESVTDCKPTEITTAFPEKLETISEKIQNLVFVPKIVFSESDEISVKRYLKDPIFEKTITSVDFGVPSDEVEKLEVTEPIQTVFGSGLRLSIDRPAIILARKPENKKFEYVEFLKRVLREIYRTHGKGLPRPAHTEASDFDEIKQDIRADRHIWVLDLDKIEIKTGYLKDRLRELYSQNFGFLVLYGSEEKLSKVKEILKLDSPLPKYHEVSINEDDVVFKLAQIIWGFPKYAPISSDFLDVTVARLEDSYFDEIERLASKISTIVSVEPSSEDEENIGGESILHYALKAFVVEYLKRIGVDEKKIRTEYEFADGRLDVYISDPELGELAVEIETLYGTGLPMLKLRKRVESRLERGLKLWVVVPNPQLMIYFKDILALRNVYRKRYGEKVEFFGVDFNSGKIVPIIELLKVLR